LGNYYLIQQWAASTGTDPQPYFRIFNPELQSKAHDPDCKFIRKWIPELKNVPTKSIHEWEKDYILYKGIYTKPIVIHKTQKEKALTLFKSYGTQSVPDLN
jgi:deoxyribodipyrimidine photo-lyase